MNLIVGFAESLTDLMFEKKLKPELLAKETGLNVYDIYHWMTGSNASMPSVSVLIKLADYFECSIEFLIGLENENSLPVPHKNLPPFSRRFAQVIKEKGMPLTRLKNLTGISSTTIFYSWMSGKNQPRINTLISVSRALDCSVDYLLGRE